MPESESGDEQRQAPPTEELWYDKILGDAIGYTRGLVTILDSLNEGFRRRGRELEEQRHHLAILQNERRSILEERAGLQARIDSLTSERDELRVGLEQRGREIDLLRHELAQSQGALEARATEIRELQAAAAAAARQAGELREIVRNMERDLRSMRQSADRSHQELTTLGEGLVGTERLREAARSDLADSQEQIAHLRSSLDEEQTRTALLEERLQRQAQDHSRVEATLQAARGILRLIAGIVNHVPEPAGEVQEADQEPAHWAGLVQAVRRQVEEAAQIREEAAALWRLVESIQEALGTMDALPERIGEVVAERAVLTQHLHQIAAQWRRILQERTESARGEPQPQEENQRLAARIAVPAAELEAQRAQAEPQPRQAQTWIETSGAGGNLQGPVEPSPEDQEVAGRQGSFAGVMVECTLEGPVVQTPLPLCDHISGINEAGMVVAFGMQLPAGQALSVRLSWEDQEFAVPGKVVRVQPSPASPGAPPLFSHLIRFQHPNPDSGQRLKAFLFQP